MTGEKKYLQPFDMLLNAIHDLAELQKARTIMCDSPRGLIQLGVMMYAKEWEYRFYVSGIEENWSSVAIEIVGEGTDIQRLIDHEFALLDYVLVDRTQIELAKIEEHDRHILAGDDFLPK